jgi:hypothetical protein
MPHGALLYSYRPTMYSETTTGYDILRDTCTSMDWMSDGVQTCTPWLMVRQVRQMEHHA